MGPLFLPHGSIRAILALSIVLGVISMSFKGVTVPEFLAVGFGLVIGLYFRDAQANEVQAVADEKLKQKDDEIKALKATQPVVVPEG